MPPPDRRCPVRAGLGPFQERLQVAQEVHFPVRCRLSVYAYGTIFPSAEVSCLQPTQVDVVGQRSESHSWRLLRQLGYPLLFCEHGIEFRCTRHVSLQRFHDEGISIPRQGPSGFVPLRHRYDEMLRLPDALVAALRFLRLAIPPLGHSLSTLRRASHLAATQDSFSGAGQALPDGIGYPQGSDERFPSCFLHLFPLSQAFLTQCHFAMVSGGARRGFANVRLRQGVSPISLWTNSLGLPFFTHGIRYGH